MIWLYLKKASYSMLITFLQYFGWLLPWSFRLSASSGRGLNNLLKNSRLSFIGGLGCCSYLIISLLSSENLFTFLLIITKSFHFLRQFRKSRKVIMSFCSFFFL